MCLTVVKVKYFILSIVCTIITNVIYIAVRNFRRKRPQRLVSDNDESDPDDGTDEDICSASPAFPTPTNQKKIVTAMPSSGEA